MKKRIISFSYKKFEEIVKKRRLTTQMVQECTGLSIYTISRWKNGKIEPRSVTLFLIAEFLKEPMENFFEIEYIDVPDDEEQKPEKPESKERRELREYIRKARYVNPFENINAIDSGKKSNYVIPFKEENNSAAES